MRRGSIIGCLLVCACDPGVVRVDDDTTVASDTTAASETVDTTTPDAEVVVPELPTESAGIARLFDGAISGFVVVDDALVIATDAGWTWVDASGAYPIADAPTHAPTAAARVDDATLITSPDGLYLIADATLAPTPLAGSFPTPPSALAPTPIGLFIGDDEHLWRLLDGHLSALTLTLPTTTPLLARGTRDTQPALWIASETEVYALTGTTSIQAWPELELAATSLATDRRGRVWATDADEVVHVRTDAWRVYPQRAHTVSAHPDSDDVWLVADDGLYHLVGDELRAVTNAPPLTRPSARANGRLLGLGADGLDELAPGRVLALLGLVSGTQLREPTEITVRATSPDAIASITSMLDESPLATTATFTLDPTVIANGDHVVATTVVYNDAQSIAADLSFSVDFPTWAEVHDLYEQRCARCHDATEGASTAVLDHPEAWTSRIDCVLCRVEVPFDRSRPECVVCQDVTSSMPPTGELTADEIELIRQWRTGKFRLE